MINLEEHKKYIYKLMKNKGVPLGERDDMYQGFCVFYYTSTTEKDDAYSMGHWLRMRFHNYLSDLGLKYKAYKRDAVEVDIDSLQENTEVYYQSMKYTPDMESVIDTERLYKKLPLMFKYLWEGSLSPAMIAQSEGVSRQAIEQRIRKEMKRATRTYQEDYA